MAAVRNVSRICSSLNQIQKSQYRSISSTAHLQASWLDKVKSVFTRQNTDTASDDSYTLLRFADEMKTAKSNGWFKPIGDVPTTKISFHDDFEKCEAIMLYLGALDPTGEKLRRAQKKEAAKHCDCTIDDVEDVLQHYAWMKERRKRRKDYLRWKEFQ